VNIEKFNSFELQLEILAGCAFNCAGCHVDRDSPNKATDKMYRVAYEFLEHLDPYAVVLGSTDIFTATNTMEILNDIRLTELIKRFDRLVVNSTMVKPDLQVLNALDRLGMKELQINVVIPESKNLNERYNAVIAEKVRDVKARFPNLYLHPQLNLSQSLVVDNYETLNNFYLRQYGQGVDFNLSFARTSNDPEQYRRAFNWLKSVTVTTQATNDGCMVDQHVDVVSPHDKLERVIIFYENEFYAIPIVYEDLIQIRDRYRVDGVEDYRKKYDAVILEQYAYTTKTKECGECPFLPTCLDHRVLSIMEDYGITECVLPKETIAKVNQW